MSNNAWLHWIGSEYSSVTDFLSRARNGDTLRPVPFPTLKEMSWNDDIYCVKKQGRRSAGLVFCVLPIKRISGLSRRAATTVKDRLRSKEIDPGGQFVDTGSETYLQGATWKVEANIQAVCAELAALPKGIEIGALMIGCAAADFVPLKPPWASLPQIRQTPGYRRFDHRAFLADVKAYTRKPRAGDGERVRLFSAYTAARRSPTDAERGQIQWGEDYGAIPKSDAQQELAFNL